MRHLPRPRRPESSRGLTLHCGDPDGEGGLPLWDARAPLRPVASAGPCPQRATPKEGGCGRRCPLGGTRSSTGDAVRSQRGRIAQRHISAWPLTPARLFVGAPPGQKGRSKSGREVGRASLLGLRSPGVRWDHLSWPRTVTGPAVTSSTEAQKCQRRARSEACGATSACFTEPKEGDDGSRPPGPRTRVPRASPGCWPSQDSAGLECVWTARHWAPGAALGPGPTELRDTAENAEGLAGSWGPPAPNEHRSRATRKA